MLDVQNLSKAFHSQELFSGVGFRVQKGDKIGLVGPNGAGKTTLLKILMGKETADSGQVNVGRETRVGYLAQEIPKDAQGTVLERALSGAAHILDLETTLDTLATRMSTASPDEALKLSQEHADVQARYQAMDGYSLLGRAKDVLLGLGFAPAQIDSPLASLSGGWHMRAELARLLISHPDILLLDEPTNHLDIKSLAWLEDFLVDYDGAFLVVSHDRYFLNRMATSIAELSIDGLYVFGGNYDDYIEARAELEEKFAKEQAAKDRRAQELRSFVERFRAKASKARQAQSRLKMLNRLEGQEVSGLAPKKKRTMRVQLPEPARSGERVITLSAIGKSYGERVIYAGVDVEMLRGERIALVGDNGAGKSTLLKILAGALAQDTGTRTLGHNVESYYFAQHQTEALNPNNTVLQEIRALVPLETETRVRGILGAFLFSGDTVDKQVSVLSGGEKNRLALAKMLAAPKNLLLLDEPTNHLDLQSRDVLETALSNFSGTVCFVSHDRYFIERLATRVVEVDSGTLTSYAGDYNYYLFKSQQKLASQNEHESKAGKPKSAHAEEREARKAAQKETLKREKESAKLEAEIQTAEARMQEIDDLLCDPKVFADHTQTQALTQERQSVEAHVATLYARWEQIAG